MFDIENTTRIADAIDKKAAALAQGSEKEILALLVAYQSEFLASQLSAIYQALNAILDRMPAKGGRVSPNPIISQSKVRPLFDRNTTENPNHHQHDQPGDQE